MQCKICQRKLQNEQTNNPKTFYCHHCGLWQMALDDIHSDREATEVEVQLMDSLEYLRRCNYHKILHRIHRLIKKNDISGFEVGCARGWFLDEAQKQHIRMSGIEPEAVYYRLIRDKNTKVCHGYFPQDLNFQEKYDFIVFNDVLEHIPDIDAALKKCKELLNPKGLLIINAPTNTGVFFHLAYFLQKIGCDTCWRRLWQYDYCSQHLWYFSPQSIIFWTKKYHFTPIEKIHLSVFTSHHLMQRIHSSFHNILIRYIVYILLCLGAPLFKLFPSDIMCIILKKK